MDKSNENINDQWSDQETSESESDSRSDYDEDEDDVDSDGETYYYSFPPNQNPPILNTVIDDDVEMNCESLDSQDLTFEGLYIWKKEGNFNPVFTETESTMATFTLPNITCDSLAYQIFQYFISESEVQFICTQSALYVTQTQESKPGSFKGFRPFDRKEFYRFLALQLLMGLTKKSSIKDYWSTSLLHENPFFGKTMSRNRFEEILRAAHFCDNSMTDFKSNRMLKLGPLIPALMQKFASCIIPGRNLCIDESLSKFKGRLSFKQYMPKKRARFGLKQFILADCSTNFVINSIPYQGETTQLLHPNTNAKDGLGYGGAVVHSLLDPYLNSKRVVYIDNWFNSPALGTLLTSKSTGVVGTVRGHRKGMPHFEKKLKKGEVEYFSNSSLQVERWLDRREVLVLTNCIPHAMKNVAKANKEERLKPASVLLYNKSMGSVDELDKILQPYVAQRKSIKWYKKFWFHHIDMVVYNSRIIFNSFKPSPDALPYKQFLERLIQEMIEANPIEKLPKGRPVICSTLETRLLGRCHFPCKMFNPSLKPKNRPCYLCNLQNERHEGPYTCGTCNVYLCISKDRSCFETYHTIRKLPVKKFTKKALGSALNFY